MTGIHTPATDGLSSTAMAKSASAAQQPPSLGADRSTKFVSGAIEIILPFCKFYLRSDGTAAPLDSSLASIILNKANDLSASLGVRIVAMAFAPNDTAVRTDPQIPADNLIFAGFQAMLDPPRRGVDAAIAALNAGGVQVVMITGDSEATARSIAKQLGIPCGGASETPSVNGAKSYVRGTSSGVLTGREIDALSQRQLADRISSINVFARTTPRHKMAIIEAFQSKGKVVAMTGDGGQFKTRFGSSLC